MPDQGPEHDRQPVNIAFVQCHAGRLFAGTVLLTPAEGQRLQALLRSLQEFGAILLPEPVPATPR